MAESLNIGSMFGSVDVETFMGLPACTDLQTLEAGIAILGVPCVTPYRSVGAYCTNAPRAIRDALAPYSANLHHVDFDLGRPIFPDGNVTAVDCGDLLYHEENFAQNRATLRQHVGTMLDRNAVPLLIGGDDSTPIPMFDAFEGRGKFTILQIDAHIDWRDEVDGERFGLSSNMRRASEMPHIASIIQVGQRAIGSARPKDYQDALDWGVHFYSAKELDRAGIEPILDLIADNANVIIALDIDGLDPTVVPGVIGRAPGGLSYWDTINLIHGVAEKARIAAFSIVEFMPERDVDQIGALTAARIIANVIGVAASANH